MTPDGYFYIIVEAVRAFDKGDSKQVEQLSKVLSEMDQAKQKLSEAGFSWTGLSLLKSVENAIEATHAT